MRTTVLKYKLLWNPNISFVYYFINITVDIYYYYLYITKQIIVYITILSSMSL